VLQRLIGVSIGALVTFLILWFSDFTNQTDLISWYVAAAVIWAVASFFWPVVAGIWFVRRRRNNAIEREVQRQMADQQK